MSEDFIKIYELTVHETVFKLTFTGGSLHSSEIAWGDLLDQLQLYKGNTDLKNPFDDVVNIDSNSIRLRLDVTSLASQGVSGDDSLTIEYDVHDQQIIRSIDGTISSNFSETFTYTPTAGFASSGFDGNDFVLNISGGQLASVNSANYSDIIDAIQVRYDGSIISGAIDSVISINSNTVKLKLNWDNIFASGASLDDYIDIDKGLVVHVHFLAKEGRQRQKSFADVQYSDS